MTPGSGPVAASRAARPPTGAIAAIRVSGLSFHSTLMHSAPSAVRNRVPPAEARNQLKSKIRMPASGIGLPSAESAEGGSGRSAQHGGTGRAPCAAASRNRPFGQIGFDLLGVLAQQRGPAAGDPAAARWRATCCTA